MVAKNEKFCLRFLTFRLVGSISVGYFVKLLCRKTRLCYVVALDGGEAIVKGVVIADAYRVGYLVPVKIRIKSV